MRARVGDRYVLEGLLARGWNLGGEGSGHLLALDRHTTGDGIISALQVLQAVCRSGVALADQLRSVTLLPQVMINVRLREGLDWRAHDPLHRAQREIEAELGSSGRILIRPSGTEPLLRVMVEARDLQVASHCAQRLAQTLQV